MRVYTTLMSWTPTIQAGHCSYTVQRSPSLRDTCPASLCPVHTTCHLTSSRFCETSCLVMTLTSSTSSPCCRKAVMHLSGSCITLIPRKKLHLVGDILSNIPTIERDCNITRYCTSVAQIQFRNHLPKTRLEVHTSSDSMFVYKFIICTK